MRVFITGGTGFVGSHLVVELLRRGDEVTLLARNPNKIPAFRDMAGISFVQGSLDDLGTIRAAMPGHDACIHNALYWDEEPTEMELKDTRASVAIFRAASEAGVDHLIYTSSTAVHRPFRPRMSEEDRLTPNDFYGATKAAGEAWLSAFSYQSEMRCNLVRPGPVVGGPAVEGGPFVTFRRLGDVVTSALRGEEILVTKGDGRQFIAVEDLARVFACVLHSSANRQAYVAVARDYVTWEQIARDAVAIAKSDSPIVVGDLAPPTGVFDTGKLQRELGLVFEAAPAIQNHVRRLVAAAS